MTQTPNTPLACGDQARTPKPVGDGYLVAKGSLEVSDTLSYSALPLSEQ